MEETDADLMLRARQALGPMWGLERSLTKKEMSRTLGLSVPHGASYVAKVESGAAQLAGPTRRYLRALLGGWPPEGMEDIVTPGYPRGAVR